MKIEKNRVATFTYEMIILNEHGEQFQQVEKSKPMKVLIGRGNLLEPFENGLLGLSKDDTFEFTLKSDQTFGPYLPKAVHEFDRLEVLKDLELNDNDLEPGSFLPLETEDGTPFNGKVVELTDDKIVLDFNHPLAGKDLLFKGKILKVRESTEEELEKGSILEKRNTGSEKH